MLMLTDGFITYRRHSAKERKNLNVYPMGILSSYLAVNKRGYNVGFH